MSGIFRMILAISCFLVLAFSPISAAVEIVAQGLPPTKGFHLSTGALPNSNIISISTGEIDAYDDMWVNPDTEIDWYYYVNSSGVYLLGAECYTPSYLMCPRLNLIVSKNLVRFRTKTKFVKGVPVNGSILFNFGKSTYKVPVSKILPYIWDKSWVEYLWGYEINGSLIFFPRITLEIRGANFRYQNCSIENGSVAVIHLIQKYNVTYYIKTS
ncbi:hypothetical protein [Thermococcus sp.]